nr:DUF2625 domain-containing protein [Actinacidiphila yanglinensis]
MAADIRRGGRHPIADPSGQRRRPGPDAASSGTVERPARLLHRTGEPPIHPPTDRDPQLPYWCGLGVEVVPAGCDHLRVRELDELVQVDDPAWPELQDVFAAGAVPVRVLAPDPDEGRRCLLQMQVTARSTLGALAWNCGGLVLDDGWLRVFGGGSQEGQGLPSIGQVNGFPAVFDPAWYPAAGLVVGHDVLGGVFVLNGQDCAAAGRPGAPGRMIYFAPDTLAWEAMDMGHSAWVAWLLSGRLETFYDGLRWPDWRRETAALDPSQGISVHPFLWSEEAHADLAATSRRAVPMREVLGVAADFARQAGPVDPGFLGEV